MTARFALAADMAARAHAGQMRRGDWAPYINHPLAVAAQIARHGADENTLCAAVLHDAVEDTDVTLSDIERAFGATVAGIVGELTDPPEWNDLSTPERKRRQVDEYRGASAPACRIKVADQWSNVTDLARGDSGKDADWLQAYLDAARAVVEVCRPNAPKLAADFDAAAAELRRVIAAMRGT